jgi:hypothetical protein
MHSNPLPISICSEEILQSSSFNNNKQKTGIRSNSCMCTAVFDDQQYRPMLKTTFMTMLVISILTLMMKQAYAKAENNQ